MARNKTDPCMLCWANPCECGKPVKPAKVKAERKTTALPKPPVVEPTDDPMPQPVEQLERPPRPLEDVSEAYAMQNIANAGLLHRDDHMKYVRQLNMQLTHTERVMIWRAGL